MSEAAKWSAKESEKTRRKRQKERRRDEGVCIECGGELYHTSALFCKKHIEARRKYGRQYTKNMREREAEYIAQQKDGDEGGSAFVNLTPDDYAHIPEHGGNETPLQPDRNVPRHPLPPFPLLPAAHQTTPQETRGYDPINPPGQGYGAPSGATGYLQHPYLSAQYSGAPWTQSNQPGQQPPSQQMQSSYLRAPSVMVQQAYSLTQGQPSSSPARGPRDYESARSLEDFASLALDHPRSAPQPSTPLEPPGSSRQSSSLKDRGSSKDHGSSRDRSSSKHHSSSKHTSSSRHHSSSEHHDSSRLSSLLVPPSSSTRLGESSSAGESSKRHASSSKSPESSSSHDRSSRKGKDKEHRSHKRHHRDRSEE